MEITTQPKLAFHGVDIIDLSFKSEKPYIKGSFGDINIQIKPRVFYPKNNSKDFKIIMDIVLNVDNTFKLSLNGIGNFSVVTDLEEDIRRDFVNVNAPAIMFPYIRAFISNFTSNIGNSTGSIIIPVHFFHGNIDEDTTDELLPT